MDLLFFYIYIKLEKNNSGEQNALGWVVEIIL